MNRNTIKKNWKQNNIFINNDRNCRFKAKDILTKLKYYNFRHAPGIADHFVGAVEQREKWEATATKRNRAYSTYWLNWWYYTITKKNLLFKIETANIQKKKNYYYIIIDWGQTQKKTNEI